ncbi:MAG: NAD(P)H-hydrate dehydratase [Ruminococcus sp.]|nr:NAD(P)H-hydrate dehydratase [Ruminococcus sp.]
MQQTIQTLTLEQLVSMLPRRQRDAQKGNFGRLLCITGSRNMPGACFLSAMGAIRSGAGLVTVATAPENPMRLAAAIPEVMWLSLKTDENGFLLDEPNHEALLPHLEKSSGILLGCGLGVTNETRKLIDWIISQTASQSKPLLFDADGLNCIADRIDIDRQTGTDWIFTPHPGEMARLCGKSIGEIQHSRIETAQQFVTAHPITLVLKGAGTLVAQPNRMIRNPTGNPGMSRGGSGDVLAGMIAGLMVQGNISSWNAACIGVYLHGLAGDLAAATHSEQAMLPTDLLVQLPTAFLRLEHLRDKN